MMYAGLKQYLKYRTPSRFTLVFGQSKKGRTEIAYFIAGKHLIGNTAEIIVVDNKVDSVREVIAKCYKQKTQTFYIFLDADGMSIAAKNSLLKVTEEPPQQAYFILCHSDECFSLPTLISRADIVRLPVLRAQEVLNYAEQNYPQKLRTVRNWVPIICFSMEDVDKFLKLENPKEFIEFVEKVVKYLSAVTVTNLLKITHQFKFKEDDKAEYDCKLFVAAFLECLTNNYCELFISQEDFEKTFKRTLKLSSVLQSNYVSHKSAFELWLMDIWKIFGGEYDE